MEKSIRQQNEDIIKELGFESVNFRGYGGEGFKKGDLEIWIDDWGMACIEKTAITIPDNLPMFIKGFRLGEIMGELLKNKIIKHIDILNAIKVDSNKIIYTKEQRRQEFIGALNIMLDQKK